MLIKIIFLLFTFSTLSKFYLIMGWSASIKQLSARCNKQLIQYCALGAHRLSYVEKNKTRLDSVAQNMTVVNNLSF